MECREARSIIDAYLDNELGAERAVEMERHLASCPSRPSCPELAAGRRALSQALRTTLPYERAPARLRRSLDAALAAEAMDDAADAADDEEMDEEDATATSALVAALARSAHARPVWHRAAGLAAAFVLVAGLSALLTHSLEPRGEDVVAQEVVASHVRALLTDDRMIDVASSDQHTVKPWFSHKLDFAPPVEDLTVGGYPLVGGRADYVGGGVVAALVYRHRKHLITLFIWPQSRGSAGIEHAELKGEHLAHWSDGAMVYWAVSDLDAAELTEFCRLFQAAAAAGEPPSAPKQP